MITTGLILEIIKRLKEQGIKDTDLPEGNLPLIGDESLVIVQDSRNKIINLSELANSFRVDINTIEEFIRINNSGN